MACESPTTIPQKQDRSSLYHVEKMVGSGSYGQVYMGRFIESGHPVAIKVVTTSMEGLKDTLAEIDLLKKFSHNKNIATYFDAFFTCCSKQMGNQLWVTMEFCGGGSLSDLIKRTGISSLKEDWISYICSEMLHGLVHLHKHNVIHRDIKGQNVMLTADGHVKLVDFGVSVQSSGTICQQKTFIGTPCWMAPEVIDCQDNTKNGYNCKSDVWSLGITAIEMAEGAPPYGSMAPMKALMMICNDPPPKLQSNEWSNAFHAFIEDCLIKDPTKRKSSSELLLTPFIKNIRNHKAIRKEIEKLCGGSSSEERQRQRRRSQQDEERMIQITQQQRADLAPPQMQQQHLSAHKLSVQRSRSKSPSVRSGVAHGSFTRQEPCSPTHQMLHSPTQQMLHSPTQQMLHSPTQQLSPTSLNNNQIQRGRSQSRSVVVPQIQISPQSEDPFYFPDASMNSPCAAVLNPSMMKEAWNQGFKPRSYSHSPCRRLDVSSQDVNGNSLSRSPNMRRRASGSDCRSGHSLRAGEHMMQHNGPQGNHLNIPQQGQSGLSLDRSLQGSTSDLAMLFMQADELQQQRMARGRSKSACGMELQINPQMQQQLNRNRAVSCKGGFVKSVKSFITGTNY